MVCRMCIGSRTKIQSDGTTNISFSITTVDKLSSTAQS